MTITHNTRSVNIADLSPDEQEVKIVKTLAECVLDSILMDASWSHQIAIQLADEVRESGYVGSLTLSKQFASADAAAARNGVVWYLSDDLTFTCHF